MRTNGPDRSFKITQIADDAVDVELRGVRYRYEARPGYSKIEARRGDELLESSEMESANGETRLRTWRRSQPVACFVARVDGDEISSTIEVGDDSYDVRSDQRSHGAELARVLQDVRAPAMPYVRRFGREYTKNADFRAAMVERKMVVPLNGGSVFCGIVCSCCLILVPDPIPGDEIPCCVACARCLLG
jgi:hypothetical protein